jgi:hypothetical protein
MDPYVRSMSRLLTALFEERGLRDFKFYYFHNCIYEYVSAPRIRHPRNRLAPSHPGPLRTQRMDQSRPAAWLGSNADDAGDQEHLPDVPSERGRNRGGDRRAHPISPRRLKRTRNRFSPSDCSGSRRPCTAARGPRTNGTGVGIRRP